MKNEEVPLLPCPFCGGKAHFDYDDNGWNWIECGECQCATNARVHAMDGCKPLLAEQWNKRVPLTVVAYANRDELDDMLDDRTATVAGVQDGWRKTPLYAMPSNAEVNGAGTASSGLPGSAAR